MKITVERLFADGRSTVGVLLVDGRAACFTLEDEHRDAKLPGETRIPAGLYRVGVRRHGGFHQRYAVRFPDFHRGMLEVLDVPGFTDVLIHIGNDEGDTAGCLLLGCGADCRPRASWTITASTVAYREVYERAIGAAEAGELTIEYIDRDRAER